MLTGKVVRSAAGLSIPPFSTVQQSTGSSSCASAVTNSSIVPGRLACRGAKQHCLTDPGSPYRSALPAGPLWQNEATQHLVFHDNVAPIARATITEDTLAADLCLANGAQSHLVILCVFHLQLAACEPVLSKHRRVSCNVVKPREVL